MDLILDLNPTAWFVDLLFEGMVLTFNLNRTTWLVDLLCKGTDLTFNSNQTAWLDDLFWERMDLTFNRNEIAWLVALLWEGMDPTFNLNQTAWLVDLLCEIDQVVQLLTHFVILTKWSYCWPTLWYWPGGPTVDLLCDIDQVVGFPTARIDAQQQTIHGGHHGRRAGLATCVQERSGLLQTRLNEL